jgi:calcineurin-like phosphoesterase family protein
MKVFFTSDMHLFHGNCIYFDNRGFESVEEMNRELIERWNKKVSPSDIVYVLGDFIWKSGNDQAVEIIKSLNGKIVLIKGNHDTFLNNEKARKLFEEIKDYDDICVKLEDGSQRRVILSHYFIPFYNGHRHQGVHLHGHSHASEEYVQEEIIKRTLAQNGFESRSYNVGCMHWNYEPITLDEILAKNTVPED